MVCSKCYRISNFQIELFNRPIQPLCIDCEDNNKFCIKTGKWSHSIGSLHPQIVLYNRQNPNNKAIGSVIMSDLKARLDIIIITGTMLKVSGAKKIIREIYRLIRN